MTSREHDSQSDVIESDVVEGHVGDPPAISITESQEQDVTSRTRSRWRIVAIWSVLLGGAAVYMVVIPVVETIIAARRPVVQGTTDWGEMTVADSIRLRAVEFLFVFWFFAFGVSLGSFLNVVAGRMARGKSISGSSRCPSCHTRITRRDIIPILGWLSLGGRCRACRVRISPRYPLVEALTGGLFVLLLFVELLSGCANIPFVRHYAYDGFVWILFYPKWDVLGMYGYHMTLLCFLVVVGLMEWERAQVPRRLALTGILLGAVLPAIWPNLHPVAWLSSRPDWLAQWSWLERIDTTLVGLLAGACIGSVLSTAAITSPRSAKSGGLNCQVASMALVGVYLGWQSALSVAVFTALFRMFAVTFAYAWPRIANVPTAGWILVATTLHICLWRTLTGWPVWPGAHSTTASLVIVSAGIVAACIIARRLSRRDPFSGSVAFESGEGVPS